MKKENRAVHQTEELTLLTTEQWWSHDAEQRRERIKQEKEQRTTRLDENFCPRLEDYDWAEERGYSKIVSISLETEKFIDYWLEIPGKRGRKLSWYRTWRNWIRRAVEWKQERQQQSRPVRNELDELHKDATD